MGQHACKYTRSSWGTPYAIDACNCSRVFIDGSPTYVPSPEFIGANCESADVVLPHISYVSQQLCEFEPDKTNCAAGWSGHITEGYNTWGCEVGLEELLKAICPDAPDPYWADCPEDLKKV